MTMLSDCANVISLPEFIPYVFQVMSLLLEMHKNEIPSSYMALFPHLLQPVLWERTGNIPPLVRLLQAYLERGASTIASAAADKIVSVGRVLASRRAHLGSHTVSSVCCLHTKTTNTQSAALWVLFHYVRKMNSRLSCFCELR